MWTQLAQGGPALSLVRNKMRRVVEGGSRPCSALVTRVSTKDATPLLEEMLDLLPEPPRHVIFLPMTPSASPSTAASQPHKQHQASSPPPPMRVTGGIQDLSAPLQEVVSRQIHLLRSHLAGSSTGSYSAVTGSPPWPLPAPWGQL